MAVARETPQDRAEIETESVAHEHGEGDDEIELLKRQLYHVHLPKLDGSGFIDWNRGSGLISRGPRFAEFELLLSLMSEHRDELPEDWR